MYCNILGTHAPDTKADIFETAIKKLNEYVYFSENKSVCERHLFRLMKQEPGGKFKNFIIRLRHRCSKGKSANTDNDLIDQITEK